MKTKPATRRVTKTKPPTRPVRITGGWTKPSTTARVLGVPPAEQRAIHAAVEAFLREYRLTRTRMSRRKAGSAKARPAGTTARKSKAPAKRASRKS
jgi:hypothetical protein